MPIKKPVSLLAQFCNWVLLNLLHFLLPNSAHNSEILTNYVQPILSYTNFKWQLASNLHVVINVISTSDYDANVYCYFPLDGPILLCKAFQDKLPCNLMCNEQMIWQYDAWSVSVHKNGDMAMGISLWSDKNCHGRSTTDISSFRIWVS